MTHDNRQQNQRKHDDDGEDTTATPRPLDEADIQLLQTYGTMNPYTKSIAQRERDIQDLHLAVQKLVGIRAKFDQDGLLPSSQWDLLDDRRRMGEEPSLQVGQCTDIIMDKPPPQDQPEDNREFADLNPEWLPPMGTTTSKNSSSSNTQPTKYVVQIPNLARFVVGLGERLAPSDVETGMRVALNYHSSFAIELPLPTRLDAAVGLMEVQDKPDVTYDDLGGLAEVKNALREVVEMPLLHPERFLQLGIDPPKGVLLYGSPGTGKTLAARAVANRTSACFIRIIGSELVQKYVGEGSRLVREVFQLARTKSACIVFFDEIDAIGGTRSGGGEWGDNEVQRTMLQIGTELDGFDARGNIKVLMATNRPDILDPALVRPGRIDRRIEFGLPDLKGRIQILRIHCKCMNVDRNIRLELIARLCPNGTGADLRSVCTEAGMFAIRGGRKSVSERDFLGSVQKVIKGYKKFSSTPKYMVYN